MSEVKFEDIMFYNIVKESSLKASYDAMLEVVENSDVPVFTGTLKRSGTVTIGDLPDPDTTFEAAKNGSEMLTNHPGPIGSENAVYGSFNTPYAVDEHENIEYAHEHGGGSKYLEIEFTNKSSGIIDKINEIISKSL
jgi:hypothetical protein